MVGAGVDAEGQPDAVEEKFLADGVHTVPAAGVQAAQARFIRALAMPWPRLHRPLPIRAPADGQAKRQSLQVAERGPRLVR